MFTNFEWDLSYSMICLDLLTTVHYWNYMAWYQVISAWLVIYYVSCTGDKISFESKLEWPLFSVFTVVPLFIPIGLSLLLHLQQILLGVEVSQWPDLGSWTLDFKAYMNKYNKWMGRRWNLKIKVILFFLSQWFCFKEIFPLPQIEGCWINEVGENRRE